ncbi:MAG TPA: glycosyltransferase family 2 protein [Legionellaceae bacterium]|nr:glycosyltransferase family 2 protein [Legionellaceae bacterium]
MSYISIVTACYNEEACIAEVQQRVKTVMESMPQYDYEHIFIDNHSNDQTVAILKEIATTDKHVKIIVNARNFGHIRSPVHGLLQAKGDAVISLVADLQDPPEMIKDFLKEWEAGHKIVVGVKVKTHETFLLGAIRRFYYNLVTKIANINLVKNFTGFGLYDKVIMDGLRQMNDPYPYFRGLICEIGYPVKTLPYTQPPRLRGFSKNNFYALYDMAILGITNHSKIPIRLAIFSGFSLAMVSFILSIVFFVLKLLFWDQFSLGVAPILIGLFFFCSILLFFIGILGEYVVSIHTQVQNRPLVFEKERVNFE